jgi:hypothetical protein
MMVVVFLHGDVELSFVLPLLPVLADPVVSETSVDRIVYLISTLVAFIDKLNFKDVFLSYWTTISGPSR